MADPNLGQGIQGAAGGASAGAAFGPWGAGIGGGLGLLAGLFGGGGTQAYEGPLKDLAKYYQDRQAPQMGPAAQSGYSDFRQNQAGLVSNLEAMARGEGPSAAALQMREAMDKAAGAQASAAAGAGGRGVNAGAALRQAMNNSAAIMQQGARDTGLMRTNEQLGAIQQLSGTLAQGRAADEGVNMFNAGQTNDAAKANMMAQLQTLGLNDEGQLKALMMAMGAAGPGLGTQLMAGGASAAPGMMQMFGSQGGGGGAGGGGGGGGLFGQFTRNGDGSTGPIISPSQL